MARHLALRDFHRIWTTHGAAECILALNPDRVDLFASEVTYVDSRDGTHTRGAPEYSGAGASSGRSGSLRFTHWQHDGPNRRRRAERDRINHVHFRNVKVMKPYEHYSEVFIDEGENNMFAVMRELIRVKYTRLIYPEHPRGIDYDRERQGFRAQYPGGGGYAGYAFNIGYAQAMMQAALTA